MPEPFIGEIRMFCGDFAPREWALCDGQLLQVSENPALFSLLGTTYGGDGRVTFGVPDLRGRAPIHAGTGPGLTNRRLGQKGGSETTALTTNQMPSHNHGVKASTEQGSSASPEDTVLSEAGNDNFIDSELNTNMKSEMITNTGGGHRHDNMSPYQVVNYIIALQGTYPSRS